jgi:hypothetical protein
MNTELITNTQPPAEIGGAEKWDLVQRKAIGLSASSVVPKEYQGPKGSQGFANCIIAIEKAKRMKLEPLDVMQNMDIIHGRPSWRAQFVIAMWNLCGRFSVIRYKFTGEKGTDTYGCIAWSIEKETGEVLEGCEITIGLAKKEGWFDKPGSKWKTTPQQMLMLRAGSWLVRVYAPELMIVGLERDCAVVDGEVGLIETKPQ